MIACVYAIWYAICGYCMIFMGMITRELVWLVWLGWDFVYLHSEHSNMNLIMNIWSIIRILFELCVGQLRCDRTCNATTCSRQSTMKPNPNLDPYFLPE